MLSQPATKVFFKTSEPRAAKWISDAIGEIEVERLKESRSMGLLGSKRSYAMEIATKPLIMPSEISGLAPLRGFIKQENCVVPCASSLPRSGAAEGVCGADDTAAGAQAALPLFDQPSPSPKQSARDLFWMPARRSNEEIDEESKEQGPSC